MSRAARQRAITLALQVLDEAAYRSRTEPVTTLEVRLALTTIWLFVRDRSWLHSYWQQAHIVTKIPPLRSCREDYYGIAAALRAEGWYAPVDAGTHQNKPGDD